MPEYIDKEHVLAHKRRGKVWVNGDELITDVVTVGAIEGVVPVFALPNVAQVRHGRWLYEPKFGSTRPYHCSLPDCGASYPGKYLFCPNCGARMDGDG